jgi:NRAMP (natural resistance-associated macrophage protein)-like metal ion transporter
MQTAARITASIAGVVKSLLWRLKEHPLSRVGPGLITGVADDDPSGIATYSQAGAQFGLDMLWTMPLAYPLMASIQSMCARIGRVTGKGLAANIKAAFPPVVLKVVVLLLLIANTLNIAADIAAMGETAELVTGIDRHAMTVIFVLGTLLLQVLVPYHRYVFFLKWLTLSLLAYAIVLFTVHVPWGEVALRTPWPSFARNSDSATVIVAVFGTTISPYLFFWQASEEVGDMRGAASLLQDRGPSGHELRRMAGILGAACSIPT